MKFEFLGLYSLATAGFRFLRISGPNQKEPMPLAGHGFLCPWIPGVPVIPGVRTDIVASPVILGISENLGIGLPLDVVGVGAKPAP